MSDNRGTVAVWFSFFIRRSNRLNTYKVPVSSTVISKTSPNLFIINGNFSGTSTEWLFVHCFQVELEMLVFVEVGKQEFPEKNPRSTATLERGECFHHCAIPATLKKVHLEKVGFQLQIVS